MHGTEERSVRERGSGYPMPMSADQFFTTFANAGGLGTGERALIANLTATMFALCTVLILLLIFLGLLMARRRAQARQKAIQERALHDPSQSAWQLAGDRVTPLEESDATDDSGPQHPVA